MLPDRRMTVMDDLTQAAIERGRQQADGVLEVRSEILEERVERSANVAEELEQARREEVATPSAELVRAAGGTVSRGVLVAEGDSWFDYPWYDVLGLLEDQHQYDVRSVAHMGDTVEAMAYMGGQLANFSRELEKVIRGRERQERFSFPEVATTSPAWSSTCCSTTVVLPGRA